MVIISWTEPITLLVCPTSDTYVHYPMAENKKLAELFFLRRIWIPAVWIMWLAWLSRSTIAQLFDSCKHQPEVCGNIYSRCKYYSDQNSVVHSGKDKGKPNVGGTNKSDKSVNGESKIEHSTAASTDSFEAPDWKITAAIIHQD